MTLIFDISNLFSILRIPQRLGAFLPEHVSIVSLLSSTVSAASQDHQNADENIDSVHVDAHRPKNIVKRNKCAKNDLKYWVKTSEQVIILVQEL